MGVTQEYVEEHANRRTHVEEPKNMLHVYTYDFEIATVADS